MFMGEYNHTIDAKGRLIIPAKFREPLGEEFVLTRGLDGCLYIYPMDEWEAFEEKLRALPLTNKDARAFSRFFVAGATTCELDKQGRILVPQTLRVLYAAPALPFRTFLPSNVPDIFLSGKHLFPREISRQVRSYFLCLHCQ